jgi:hypothetical protein
VRVRDVMRIKSIPVVRGRQVVGIVARRDLLEALLARDVPGVAAAWLDEE